MEFEEVQKLVESYGPLAVGLGSTLDNTGVPIFFVAGMVTAGALEVPIEAMLVAAFLGSIVGDVAVYVIGRYFLTKDRILAGRFGRSFQPVLDAGEKTMRRWGFLSVLFGRFIPYVGKVTPFLAGSYKTAWLLAISAIALGSALLMGLYYLLGKTAIDLVQEGSSTIKSVSLAIGLGCIAGLWWLNRVLQQRGTQQSVDGEADDTPADDTARKSRYR